MNSDDVSTGQKIGGSAVTGHVDKTIFRGTAYKIIDTVLLLQLILTCVAGAEDFSSQNSGVGSAFNKFGGGRVDNGIVDEMIFSGMG